MSKELLQRWFYLEQNNTTINKNTSTHDSLNLLKYSSPYFWVRKGICLPWSDCEVKVPLHTQGCSGRQNEILI
jgi:hypothetical protein